MLKEHPRGDIGTQKADRTVGLDDHGVRLDIAVGASTLVCRPEGDGRLEQDQGDGAPV